MEETKEILPLGSVVLLKGSARAAMIVGRGVGVSNQADTYRFDYAACGYPEGVVNDRLMFFDEKDIGRILFYGYRDESSRVIEEAIIEWKKGRKEEETYGRTNRD